jgi:hypothetical protein
MIEINVKELNSNKTTYITSNLTLKETKLSKKRQPLTNPNLLETLRFVSVWKKPRERIKF